MRVDKAITQIKSNFHSPRNKIPILMYHSVNNEINSSQHPYLCTVTTPRKFERQMQLLVDNNYTFLKLSEINGVLNDNSLSQKKKYVIITFDDGYEDFYKFALPVLREFSIPANVFIPAGIVESDKPYLEDGFLMDWNQISTCVKFNVEVGSHSLTHGSLVTLTYNKIKRELSESKEIIEKRLSLPINSFSYPYKFPEERKSFIGHLSKMLFETGYEMNVTTRIGCFKPGDDMYKIKRIPVNDYDDDNLFNAKLIGAYDWLHIFQLLTKKIRGLIK